jgi:hypothetical protein
MSLTTPPGFLLLPFALALFITALNMPTNPRSITVPPPLFHRVAPGFSFFASNSRPSYNNHVHQASGNRGNSVGRESYHPSTSRPSAPANQGFHHTPSMMGATGF